MSLRTRLKTLTRPLHDKLESLEISKKLLSHQIDKADYIAYLIAMKAIHKQVESHFDTYFSANNFQHLIPRQRLALIIADLDALGYPHHSSSEPQAKAWLIPWSLESLLGALYVLEGSTPGGQMIAKKTNHIVGNDRLVATRYFCGYGENNLAQWQLFTQFLDEFDTKHANTTDKVVLGAIATFLSINQLLKTI
jgi:heme oxygenase